ncbi:MAG TPA: tetratricopeptide repeat protein [Trichocoleus sp.]
MTAEPIDLAKTEYASGQAAFERGRYREAVEHLEKAVAIARPTTPLGGEIQIWLVNAYSAVGRPADAVALCEALTAHPQWETRKQAKNLLYILQAPSLQKREDWNTKIPDLGSLTGEGSSNAGSYNNPAPKAPRRPKPAVEEPVDLSQVNTNDNLFLWIALGLGSLLLLGITQLS